MCINLYYIMNASFQATFWTRCDIAIISVHHVHHVCFLQYMIIDDHKRVYMPLSFSGMFMCSFIACLMCGISCVLRAG